jgi:hypothetical protein
MFQFNSLSSPAIAKPGFSKLYLLVGAPACTLKQKAQA